MSKKKRRILETSVTEFQMIVGHNGHFLNRSQTKEEIIFIGKEEVTFGNPKR